MITTQVILHCEHEGCKERITRESTPRILRKEAKEHAKWSRVGGKDYCKDHKPTYKRVLVPAE